MSTEPISLKHPFGDIERFRTAITYLKELGAPHTDEDYANLIAIYFEVPFQVPWPDRPIATTAGNTFVITILQPHKRLMQSHFGFPTYDVVTGVTLAGPAVDVDELNQETMSAMFDFGLSFLNTFLTSYSIVTKDGDIGPVTLPMLSLMALWGHVKPFEDEASLESMLVLNPTNVPYEKPAVPDNVGAEIMSMCTAVSRGRFPFLTSWTLRIEGEHSLWNGRYHVATILIANAFEARVNELLRYFFWKEGKSEDELNTVLEQPSFTHRVTSQLHPRIGGVFDINKPGPIKHWYRFTRGLRNKVVHGGYRPSRDEARHALSAMVQAWDYLMAQARKRKKKYPELQPFIQNRGGQFIWPQSMSSEDKKRALEGLGLTHTEVLQSFFPRG